MNAHSTPPVNGATRRTPEPWVADGQRAPLAGAAFVSGRSPWNAARIGAAVPGPEARQVVLVLAAHCDDEVIGPGATLAMLSRAPGCHVVVVVLAAADFGRRRESVRAGARLGIPSERILFDALPDGELDEHRPEIRAVVRCVIRELKPSLVLTHRADAHPDHRAVREAVLDVAGHTPGVSILGFKIPQHRLVPFSPNAFVRVPHETILTKLSAFTEFASQQGKTYFRTFASLGPLEEAGVSAGTEWAEPFEIERLCLHPTECGCFAVGSPRDEGAWALEASPDAPRVVLELCPRCHSFSLAQ